MHEGEDSYVHHSNLIQDLVGLQCCFPSYKFYYVSRMRNNVSYKLEHPWQVEDLCIWWDSVSNFLLSPLWVDANNLLLLFFSTTTLKSLGASALDLFVF